MSHHLLKWVTSLSVVNSKKTGLPNDQMRFCKSQINSKNFPFCHELAGTTDIHFNMFGIESIWFFSHKYIVECKYLRRLNICMKKEISIE